MGTLAFSLYSGEAMTFSKSKLLLATITAGITAALAATAVQHYSSVATISSAPTPTAGYRDIVKRVAPAVVDVAVTKVIKASAEGPEMEQFRRFFAPNGQMQPRDRRAQGAGSGVIVNKDGYVLTNNHVVEGATEVKVRLSDKREFKATVVGHDEKSDIAVLRIEAGELPFMKFADSSKVEVGDTVLAIGNPFGVGQTVTMGIVSATGRGGLGIEDYEDFLQTDAAINKGNSGGALVNTNGDLVGINTAILSGSGANNGVAFAIPSNMALGVMEQLVKNGKVTRAQLGITVQAVSPAIAKSFGLKDSRGALVGGVSPNSPAAEAGLKPGDVILSLNGQPVSDNNQLRNRISMAGPGSKVEMEVWRDGASRQFTAKLSELSAKAGRVNGEEGDGKEAADGIVVEELTPDLARKLELPAKTEGVLVRNVDPDSAAGRVGLQAGDVIVQVNRKGVASAAAFKRALKNAGADAVLLVNRGGNTFFVTLG